MPSIDYKDRSAVVLLGLLVVLCLASVFLMVPVGAKVQGRPTIPSFPLLLAIVGCVLAQGCLLAAWLAWSDQPFWQRLTRHWLAAAILYLVWVAGLALSQPSALTEFGLIVGLSVPLVSIAAQTPLWIARQTFGWRLIRGEKKNDPGPAPLSIRDLMTATVLVALALGLARLARSPDDKELGFVWILWFVVASTISAMTLLPTAPLLLRMQLFQRGMLFAGLYAVLWVGLIWLVVLTARLGGFPVPPLAVVVGVSCLILSFAATVMLAAAAARARGYQLVWGRLPRRSGGI